MFEIYFAWPIAIALMLKIKIPFAISVVLRQLLIAKKRKLILTVGMTGGV